MKSVLVAGCEPAKKSRNVFPILTVCAALGAFALPAAAQSIVVTGGSPADAVAAIESETTVSAGPPRSITTPYVPEGPRSRGPLGLLVQEPQSPQIAATTQPVIADTLAPTLRRTPPAITVTNVSFPSTAN